MRQKVEIVCDRHTDVGYRMFDPPLIMKCTMRAIGFSSLYFVCSLVILSQIALESRFK